MNPLYDIPKDIMVKMISTVKENTEKEYSNYILFEISDFDTGIKEFNELEFKKYMIERIYERGDKSLLDTNSDIQHLITLFATCSHEDIKIIKGKFLKND